MANLTELLGEKESLKTRVKALTQNPYVTVDELNKAGKELQDLNALIEQEQEKRPVNEPLWAAVGGSKGTITMGPFVAVKDKIYRNMWGNPVSSTEFKTFPDFAKTVKMGDSQRLGKITNGMVENIPSSGGFLVPAQFSEVFIDKTIEGSVLLPGVSMFPMTTNRLMIPAWDSHDHSNNGVFGGISAQWGSEAAVNAIQTPKPRKMELQTKLLILITAASEELAEDALNLEGNLEQGLSSATAWEFDYQLINGGGAGKPLGVMKAKSTITVSKETAQVSGTIVYANIVKMLASLHPACWGSAVFLAHPSTLGSLLQLSLPIGTAGSIVPAFTFENGNYNLLGKRVLFTEKCQPVGTSGDLILLDRSQYAVGLRKDITMDVSDHVFFTSLQKAYRVVFRADGQPLWEHPVTPANGAAALSWAVVLQTR